MARSAWHGSAVAAAVPLALVLQLWVTSAAEQGLPVSCDVAPEMHHPGLYPESRKLWSRVTRLIDHYKEVHGLCQPSSKIPHWPPIPAIKFYNLTMSDGATLWTITVDVTPKDGEKKAAVLCRSPYGPTTQKLADVFTLTNGQVAVMQDDRGTFKSTGQFDLWRGSGQDTLETMEWILQQPWSNGEVYTVGLSADGLSAATVVLQGPSMIKGQWYLLTTMDGHDFIFPQGAYRLDMLEAYLRALDSTDHDASPRVISEVHHHEPWSMWWYNLTACRDISSPVAPQCHYQQVKWPVIFTMGVWDIFHKSSLVIWDGLRMDGDPAYRDVHVLFIGPIGHCFVSKQVHPIMMLGEAQGYLKALEVSSEYFRGDTQGPARASVKRINFFVHGAYDGARSGNYWTSMDEFPQTTPVPFYLASGGELLPTRPQDESFFQYQYDPKNPTPMLGGANIPQEGSVPGCGPEDMTERNIRSDVIIFDAERLQSDTVVAGRIFVRLYVSSSAKDTDFFVTVEDVNPKFWPFKATSYLVRYGIARMRWRNSDEVKAEPMEPGKVYEVGIDCGFTSYIFERGHHIRVTVSSAAYPYFNANSNTDLFELDGKVKPVIADNAVHVGGQMASVLLLPIVDFETLERNTHFDRPIPSEVLEARGAQSLDAHEANVLL